MGRIRISTAKLHPAGNRRTRPSGQVPRSFAPARTLRASSGQAPSASVRHGEIHRRASTERQRHGKRQRRGQRQADSAQFFSENRTRHSQHGSGCRRTAQHSAVASADVFRLIPQRRAQSVGYAGFPALIASSKRVHEVQPSWPAGGGNGENGNGTPSASLRITLCAIAVLVAALILSVFGAWQWVDSKLNRSDWLTDTPNTPASTWLILGSDERDGSTDYGGVDNISGFRTDTILVLIKPKSGPSSLVSIPRDSLMNVDNQYMKINAVALIAGKKALVSNVEQITGQKIDHVAQIKFGGLQNVVNALGGIELCYDEDVQDSYSGLNWKAGCHTADGSTALSFSRMRYADARGDFGRNERQRQVISAIVKKASSSETLTNPSKIVAVSNAAMSALTVDEKTNPYTLLTMALAFKSATGSNGISGSVYWSDPDYYVDGVGSSVLLDDAKNTELFNQLADGTYKAGTVGNLAEG